MVFNKKINQGFTLVELVTTIILIGILAVSVLPRLINISGYSAFSVRNKLISELRTVQQQALSNSDTCYRVVFNANGYQVQKTSRNVTDCDDFSSVAITPWKDDITVSSLNSQTFNISFDSVGGITISNGCVGDCIKVMADDSVNIELTTAGYISASQF